jgi:hypothetical protein
MNVSAVIVTRNEAISKYVGTKKSALIPLELRNKISEANVLASNLC